MKQDTRADGPGIRLMRLWLWIAPLGMLALALLFGLIAIDEGKWGLLAVMVVLTLTALGLFVLQWHLLRQPGPTHNNKQARG